MAQLISLALRWKVANIVPYHTKTSAPIGAQNGASTYTTPETKNETITAPLCARHLSVYRNEKSMRDTLPEINESMCKHLYQHKNDNMPKMKRCFESVCAATKW